MKLKIIVAVSLFIFWTVFVAIVTAGIVSKPGKATIPTSSVVKNNSGTQSNITLSSQEIAKHNNANDCWMVIGGKVYDVTNVINSHPGGAVTILNHCGQESTTAFNAKDRFPGKLHSSFAQVLLGNYLLGDINSTINSANLNNVQQKSATASQQLQNREFEDD